MPSRQVTMFRIVYYLTRGQAILGGKTVLGHNKQWFNKNENVIYILAAVVVVTNQHIIPIIKPECVHACCDAL